MALAIIDTTVRGRTAGSSECHACGMGVHGEAVRCTRCGRVVHAHGCAASGGLCTACMEATATDRRTVRDWYWETWA
jgi:hypothetical protein